MSSKHSLIVMIATAVLLAAAVLFQLLEMHTFELFTALQQRIFGAPAAEQAASSPAAPDGSAEEKTK